jgi:hypothetical protein
MKTQLKLVVNLGLFFLLFAKIYSQNCGCEGALAQDKIESSAEGFQYLHALNEIDVTQYDQIKKSTGGSLKYKLIEGSLNYSDFKDKLKKEILKTETETKSQYSISYYEVRTNPIAYKSWIECMENCNQTGLILLIQHETKNSLTFLLKYRPAPGNYDTLNYTVGIVHYDGSVADIQGKIIPMGTEPISVQRKCDPKNEITETLVSVKGAGYSTNWNSSKFYCETPPPPPPPKVPSPENGLFTTILASQNNNSTSKNVKWSQDFGCPVSVGDQYQSKLQYQFHSPYETKFSLIARYASRAYRPVKISINGVLIDDHFAHCFDENGSWSTANLKDAVDFTSIKGTNVIVIEAAPWTSGFLPIPHFHGFEILSGVDSRTFGGCD